jgi:membrane-associated phospholipid phosphatase
VMKNRHLSILLWGAAIFIAFLFFSYLVHKNLFTQLDFDTTVRLQNKMPMLFATPFSVLSLVGSFEIVLALLLIFWAFIKKLKFIFVLFFFGLIHLIELFSKAFVSHPGPPFLFFKYDLGFTFPSSYIQPGSSYPSGHLARTAFIAVLFAFIIYCSKKLSATQKRLLYCLIVIIAGLMFTSRIYLGEHWLSDVIGGSLLGAAMGLFSTLFLL